MFFVGAARFRSSGVYSRQSHETQQSPYAHHATAGYRPGRTCTVPAVTAGAAKILKIKSGFILTTLLKLSGKFKILRRPEPRPGLPAPEIQ